MLNSPPPPADPVARSFSSLSRFSAQRGYQIPIALLLTVLTVAIWWNGWGQPALEDDKFWWIPQGLIEAQRGPTLFPDGELPSGLLPPGAPLPPQWTGGIPDYGHPPLFFLYLGAWYRALGPDMRTSHLALLPLALALTLGMVRLVRRVAGADGVLAAGICLLLSPPVVSQMARADLDLPLLALTPWALEALLARRRLRFAALAAVAVWVKEPGVLLAVPALVQAVAGPTRTRRGSLLAAASPPAALAAWMSVHRARAAWGLAEPERLAPGLWAQLHDLAAVGRFVLLEQGRVVLTLAALVALVLVTVRGRFPGSLEVSRRGFSSNEAWWVLAAHTSIHVLFFGIINFLGGDPLRVAGSHLRYLLPALPSLTALGAMALPVLLARPAWRMLVWAGAALPALLDWHGPPAGGVERNLYALDVARAQLALGPQLGQAIEAGQAVWVGSYAYLDFSSPVVGISPPLTGLRPYGQSTDPASIPDGALVLESAHGEPLGRLSQQLELRPLTRATVHNGWAQLYVVTGRRK